MKKYRVSLAVKIPSNLELEVCANTEKEALKKALGKYAKCRPLSPAPTDRDKILTDKFSEFGCDSLLNNEVPNRDKYTCG